MLLDKKETACSLIQSLSQFYRISLSKGRDIITLEQELQMIESYLDIEKAGYDGQIQWEISCNKQALSCGIPKFTLQPVVENSILHGCSVSPDTKLIISIHIYLEKDITVMISDNGPGVSKEKLSELNTLLASPNLVRTSGYGLQNCSQRIRLFYGSPYGIRLKDGTSGLTTCILLPPQHLDPS